mmetsp:Transcript_3544/g.5386  ORF Transcript_3544/g.5386 Transcript_3544/m.5386 type:complete len:342 (-) Transcript_3544:1272-2297(-)
MGEGAQAHVLGVEGENAVDTRRTTDAEGVALGLAYSRNGEEHILARGKLEALSLQLHLHYAAGVLTDGKEARLAGKGDDAEDHVDEPEGKTGGNVDGGLEVVKTCENKGNDEEHMCPHEQFKNLPSYNPNGEQGLDNKYQPCNEARQIPMLVLIRPSENIVDTLLCGFRLVHPHKHSMNNDCCNKQDSNPAMELDCTFVGDAKDVKPYAVAGDGQHDEQEENVEHVAKNGCKHIQQLNTVGDGRSALRLIVVGKPSAPHAKEEDDDKQLAEGKLPYCLNVASKRGLGPAEDAPDLHMKDLLEGVVHMEGRYGADEADDNHKANRRPQGDILVAHSGPNARL